MRAFNRREGHRSRISHHSIQDGTWSFDDWSDHDDWSLWRLPRLRRSELRMCTCAILPVDASPLFVIMVVQFDKYKYIYIYIYHP